MKLVKVKSQRFTVYLEWKCPTCGTKETISYDQHPYAAIVDTLPELACAECGENITLTLD